MTHPDPINAAICAAEARTLAARFMAATHRTVGDVASEALRLLGHPPRKCASRLIWSDVLELVAVLAAESPTYAGRLRRVVAVADRVADRRAVARPAHTHHRKAG